MPSGIANMARRNGARSSEVTLHASSALLDIHQRAHQNLAALLEHCRALPGADLNREQEGFGYASVRLQLHHAIGAERYWVGVLQGQMLVDDDDPAFPTIDSLEILRVRVAGVTEDYLRGAAADELNKPRPMTTWGGKERHLVPARIVMRVVTHLYHHQGQVVAMCRLLGKPAGGLDYPLA